MIHHFQPVARPRKRDPQDLADAGLWAIGQQHHPIRKQKRLVHIVGNQNTGELLVLGNLHQLLLQAAAGEGVQRPKRLIQQQHPRSNGQSPGNGHPLFHPSRQMSRALVGCPLQTHAADVLFHDAGSLCLGKGSQHFVHGQGDVFPHCQPGQQGIVLKHHHAIGARLCDLPAFQQHAAAGGLFQASDDVEQGGLAAAGVAN